MKTTKREMFARVIALVDGMEMDGKAEMLKFLEHEVELLEKKSSKSGQTKAQKENEVLMDELEQALAEMGKAVTITEFQNASASEVAKLSNQKLSALLKKCVDDRKTVVKTVEKKKAYFSIA